MPCGSRYVRTVIAMIVVALGVTVPAGAGWVQGLGTDIRDPRVFPPSTFPFGKSYGEWAAEWWQWVHAIPVTENPLFDESGAKCMVGQRGPVWFLTGVINISGTVTRHCAIPEGTALFMPLINITGAVGLDPETSVSALRDGTKFVIDLVTDLLADLDGIPVRGVELLRFTSPAFSVTLPPDNFTLFQGNPAGVPGTYFPAVDDGFYIMFKPLSVGTHVLRIHAAIPSFDFVLDVTYHLTVLPLIAP